MPFLFSRADLLAYCRPGINPALFQHLCPLLQGKPFGPEILLCALECVTPSASLLTNLYILQTCTYYKPVHTTNLYILQTCTYYKPVHTTNLYILQTSTYYKPVHTTNLYILQTCTYYKPVHTTNYFSWLVILFNLIDLMIQTFRNMMS